MSDSSSLESGEWVGGGHAVLELLEHHPERVLEVWFARKGEDQLGQAIVRACRRAGVKMRSCRREDLASLLPGVNHQGVAARWGALGYASLEDLLSKDPPVRLVLALDGVMDPGNLGAILRSARCFGVGGVILPRHRAVGLTATAVKASTGAAFEVPVCRVTNLSRAIRQAKERGYWVYGASADGDLSLEEVDFGSQAIVVLGGEGKGLGTAARAACDLLMRIPISAGCDSLNVSVAAGIILYRAWLGSTLPSA